MPLYLVEIVPARRKQELVDGLLSAVAAAAGDVAGEVIESQVSAGFGTVFVVAEAGGSDVADDWSERLRELAEVAAVDGPQAVRLVGAELAEVKAARPAAGFLVEWDLPAELDMETYLATKKAKASRYAEVPETTFLRTYVREDMDKCLCLYDAPDEDAVRRARKAVDTPVDRLHTLAPNGGCR